MRMAPLARPPQAFEIVKLARPRGENVDDEVDIVEEYPLAFGLSFDVQGAHTLFFKGFFDVFRNCLVVARRCPGADEEIIGERADLAKFDHDRVQRFLVECCFDGVG